MGRLSFFTEFIYRLRYSLRYRLVASVMGLTLIPLLIGGNLFYYYLFDALKYSNDKYLNTTLQSQANELDSKLRMVESTSMLIISDPEIRRVLLLMENDPAESGTASVTINDSLKSLMLFNYAWDSRLIKSLYLITPDSKYYFITRNTSYSLTAQYLVESMKEKTDQEQYLILPSSNNKSIFLCRKINDLHFMKNYATLFIEIDQDSLMHKNKEEDSNLSIMLISEDNIIVSHTDPSMIGSTAPDELSSLVPGRIAEITVNGIRYLAVSKKSSDYNLLYVVSVPIKEAYSRMISAQRTFSVIFIVVLTLSLVIGIISAFTLTSPLKKITKTLSDFRAHNFKAEMPAFSTIELNELSLVYNKMANEIDHLINQVYEKQLLLTEAELQSLLSQVNPHFLFNILENINWEARISKNEKIYEMTLALGSLLRATIYYGKKEKLSLADELQLVSQYMNLQQMRFGDKINFELDIDKNLLEYYVPRFCIQSIVENSVIHGLEKKRGKGLIKVKAVSSNDSIYITVTDDGVGFDTSMLNLELPRTEVESKRPHTGLYNTHKRIRLLYGNNYGLSVHSTIGTGTTVTIHIPLDRKG